MKDALFSFGQCVSTVRYIVQTAGVLGTDSPGTGTGTGTGQSMSQGGGGERVVYGYVCNGVSVFLYCTLLYSTVHAA